MLSDFRKVDLDAASTAWLRTPTTGGRALGRPESGNRRLLGVDRTIYISRSRAKLFDAYPAMEPPGGTPQQRPPMPYRRYRWVDLSEPEKEAVRDCLGVAGVRAAVGLGVVSTLAAGIASGTYEIANALVDSLTPTSRTSA